MNITTFNFPNYLQGGNRCGFNLFPDMVRCHFQANNIAIFMRNSAFDSWNERWCFDPITIPRAWGGRGWRGRVGSLRVEGGYTWFATLFFASVQQQQHVRYWVCLMGSVDEWLYCELSRGVQERGNDKIWIIQNISF